MLRLLNISYLLNYIKVLQWRIRLYRLWTKLREGDVSNYVYQSACPFTGSHAIITIGPRHKGILQAPAHPVQGLHSLLVTPGGQGLLKLVHIRTPPPVLTSGDHRQITYDWQPSRTHPTGMLSCHLIQIMQMMKNSVGRIWFRFDLTFNATEWNDLSDF